VLSCMVASRRRWFGYGATVARLFRTFSAKVVGLFEKILPLHKSHVKQLIQTPFIVKDNS
jgi:hypothetical protein